MGGFPIEWLRGLGIPPSAGRQAVGRGGGAGSFLGQSCPFALILAHIQGSRLSRHGPPLTGWCPVCGQPFSWRPTRLLAARVPAG